MTRDFAAGCAILGDILDMIVSISDWNTKAVAISHMHTYRSPKYVDGVLQLMPKCLSNCHC